MASSGKNIPVCTSRLPLADGENKGTISGSLCFFRYRSHRYLYASILSFFTIIHLPPSLPQPLPTYLFCALAIVFCCWTIC